MKNSNGWNRPLRELMPVLLAEATEHVGRWAWRQLPRGAWVAVLVQENYLAEARIGRAGNEPVGAKRDLWLRELAIFRQHLGIDHWQLLGYDRTRGKRGHFVWYREPDPIKAQAS